MDIAEVLRVSEPGQPSPVSRFMTVEPACEAPAARPLVGREFAGHLAAVHDRVGGMIPPLGFHRLANALAGHEGVVLAEDGLFFAPSDVIPGFWRDSIAQRMAQPGPGDPLAALLAGDAACPIRRLDPDVLHVLITKSGEFVYGHWLLDMLPRIWLTQQHLALFDKPIRYLVTSVSPGWAFDLMADALGIRPEEIVLWNDRTEAVLVPDLAIPSLLRTETALSPLMTGFVATVRQRLGLVVGAAAPTDRLFISRETVVSWSPRRLGNRDALLPVLQNGDFTTFDPASRPWAEQIARFDAAAMIAGEFGSGLHTTLFAGAGTANLVLAYSHLNTLQAAIAALRGQAIGYLAPEAEDTAEGVITYSFDPAKLAALIAALAAAEA